MLRTGVKQICSYYPAVAGGEGGIFVEFLLNGPSYEAREIIPFSSIVLTWLSSHIEAAQGPPV